MKQTIPNAFVQICEETHTQTTAMNAMELMQFLNSGSTCITSRVSRPFLWVEMWEMAGSTFLIHSMKGAYSVINSPCSFRSYKDFCMVDTQFFPGNFCSSICNMLKKSYPCNDMCILLIHLKGSNSLISKITSKKYNMQSVNIRIALTNNLYKGIFNNNMVIDICLSSLHDDLIDYKIRDIITYNMNYHFFSSAVTESIILTHRNKIVITTNHYNETKYNKIGALLEVQKQYQSQCITYNKSKLLNLEVKCVKQSNIPENNIAILKMINKNTSSFTGSSNVCGDQPDNYKSDYATNSALFNILSYQESENLSGIAFDMNDISENQESSNNLASENGQSDFIALTNGFKDLTLMKQKSYHERWGISPRLRLCGGGESSLNSGTTGWGSPPGSNTGNANSGNWGTSGGPGASQAQWNANSATGTQRPPTSQPDGSSNKANTTSSNTQNVVPTQGNNTQNNNNGPNWSTNPGPTGTNTNQSKPVSSAGNSASGPNNGNINTSNAPINPASNAQTPASGALSSTTTNPCSNSAKNQLEQLNTMRESLFSQDGWGGQHVNQDTNWDVPGSPEPSGPKPDPSTGPPVWKPSINNGTDLWEANLRNGGQPPPQPAQKTPWGHTPTTHLGGTWGEDDAPSDSNVWTGGPTPSPQQWGTNNVPSSGMWGGNKKENEWGNTASSANTAGASWASDSRMDPRGMTDPREVRDMRSMMLDPRVMGSADLRNNGDMRGDTRGISGRLNGSTEMWAHQMGPNKMVPPGQWTVGPNTKDMMTTKPSGWEEPSPPVQRRNLPNFDDGTSLWGGQGTASGAAGGGSGRLPSAGSGVGLAHWKDPSGVNMSGRGGGIGTGPGGPAPNRLPNKPDPMWMSGPRNGSWDENPHNWDDKSGMSWTGGDNSMNPGGWGGGPKVPKPSGWADNDISSDWKPNPPSKQLTKEIIWNSKQFRILCEMGYKKEDVEHALRNRDMNCEEALELLSQFRGNMGAMDNWGRHRDDVSFDHPPNRFPQSNMPLGNPTGNGPNLLNNMGSGTSNSNPGLGINSNMSAIAPALVQKIVNQTPFSQSGSQTSPSTLQLRMLVQQIQMAVQAGYLNQQILNQPLAPQTLILLNQLLQQIKSLHQYGQQHGSIGRGNNANSLHVSVQITKTKQQIQNLQNQIAAQQAIYIKQQTGGHIPGSAGPPEFFKGHETISSMQGSFSEMSINKDVPVGSSQQSRLNQWKLPSLDKDVDGSDFSRAPGTSKAQNSSPNMNPLGLQNDGTWSTGRNIGDGWPTDSSGDLTDGKEWPVNSQSAPAFTDLVPEFEPGKPWKGNQLKSIEDDPSITPGSVVRSPLSIASIKDSEIFTSNKTSPTTVPELQPLSLSNSTWSFNPSTTQSFSSSLSKLGGAKSSWSAGETGQNAPSATTAELWGAPVAKSRGPPPGLANKSWNRTGWASTWLLLRNLTAQIDGSTLKTLCMQHGPLHSFHLYLNHGIALAKYSSREEANKAQTALNNCVLGNTTIFAENPSDTEVNNYLQSLAHGAPQPPSQVSQGSWRPPQPPSKQGADTWGGSVWPPSGGGGGSLWANSLDGPAEQRGTPSSLNSFLPGDLLGNEPM